MAEACIPEKKKIPSIDVGVNINPDEKAIGRALTIIEWYLADHPDKTIVVEQEGDLRVCLIANVKREESNAEEKQSI